MSDNWIVGLLNDALDVWNGKLNEIWQLLTETPYSFMDGAVWHIMLRINEAMKAIGYALLVLFFLVGLVKTCSSFADVKRPEMVLKLFVRFAIAKGIISYGMQLLIAIIKISQGIILKIMDQSSIVIQSNLSIPQEIAALIEDASFLSNIPMWIVALLACIIVWVLSFVMILMVYGRFFKIYIFTAISPLPLSAAAGEPTQRVAGNFLKSYAVACLEGAVIVIACVIYTIFAKTAPTYDLSTPPVQLVWKYMGSVIFNMLILVGVVKGADRVLKEIVGM